MRLHKLAPFAVTFFLYVGCKKSEVQSAQNDDCFTTNSIDNGAVIEGQYIVAYKPVDSLQKLSTQRLGSLNKDVLAQNGISATAMRAGFGGAVTGFVAKLNAEEAARLRASSLIQAIEPDRVIALNTCFTLAAPSLVTWNIKKVGYGNGIGKTAWVLDTGIDFDHPDLTVDVTRSKSFLGGTTTADDENGHGTHVAGIIGGKNNTIGVLGVASGATLVSCRILDKEGKGTLSATIQALAYVNANAKAGDVVNMSFGEDGVSDVLDQQVKATAAKGVYIAIAAGNDNKAANLFSPARANGTNIYTVSAIDSLNQFASFSNFGNDVVDFAAPGVRILSTYKDGQYAWMSGTSEAAPHVAGLLLLNGGSLHYSGTALNDPDGTPDKIVAK